MGGHRIDTGLAAPEKSRNPRQSPPECASRWRKQFPHGLHELCTGVFLKRTNDFSGDTHHEAVRRNVLRDNRSGSDY